MKQHNPAICAEGDGGPCADCRERIEIDGIERLYECPWCLTQAVISDHIRHCSNYQKAYTEAELQDAYSEPSERHKLEALLK